MKRSLTLLALALGGLLVFAGKLLWDAGFFYRARKLGFDQCRLAGAAPGAEDMAYSRALGRLVISSDPRPGHGEPLTGQGALLAVGDDGRLTPLLADLPHPFHPHGIDVLDQPNGLARLFVVSHQGAQSVVEIFEGGPKGPLRHLRTVSDPGLLTPNDVIALGPDSFYVTQDHGSRSRFLQSVEHFTRIGRGSLALVENGRLRTLVGGISFANGLAYDRGRKLLYVAATLEKAVRVYRVGATPADLAYSHRVELPAGPDNLVLGEQGELWVGAHPAILTLKKHAEDHARPAPSLVLRVDAPWTEAYRVRAELEDDGTAISAASVAHPSGSHLYVGAIYEHKVLDCPLPR